MQSNNHGESRGESWRAGKKRKTAQIGQRRGARIAALACAVDTDDVVSYEKGQGQSNILERWQLHGPRGSDLKRGAERREKKSGSLMYVCVCVR